MAEGRHVSTSRTIKPAYLIAGSIAVLGLIVAVLVLVTGGSDSPLVGGHTPVPTPAFTFTAGKTVAVTTVPDPDQAARQKATQAAKPAATNAEKVLHSVYTNAFLVPDDWMGGSYDDAFDAFSEPAKAQALKQVDALTAGTDAGDTYTAITPVKATIKTKVLMDTKGQPYSTVSTVTFTATASEKDGSGSTLLVSKAQYILEKTSSGWKITAFTVSRADQPSKTGGSGSSSGSGATPTAEAS